MRGLYEGNGGTAKPGSGESGTDASGGLEGGLNHLIEFGTGDFVVVAEGGVAGDHERSDLVEVTTFEGGSELFCSFDFRDDVAGTLFHGGVEDEVEEGEVCFAEGGEVEDSARFFALGTAFVVTGFGERSGNTGIEDDDGDAIGNWDGSDLQGGDVDLKGVALDSACGCKLIHDSAVDTDVLVFAELAELGELDGSVA